MSKSYLKKAGDYKQILSLNFKENGVYKKAEEAYVKENGVYKQFYKAMKSAILPFNGGTTANMRIATVGDSDWTIDWGDGTVETFPSSTGTIITHTYASSFTGNVTIYGDVRYLYSTDGSYDFTNVVNFTNLTYLYLQGPQFTGDMSGVSSLTLLNTLRLYGDQFTGDMSGVSALSLLNYLYLQGPQFTGYMTGISNLTLLNQLYLIGNQFTYTYSPLSADFRNFYIRLKSGELSNPTDIDSILIDIDNSATSGGGSIDLRSSGAASPTAASAAAVTSLTNKGRTVLTN